ncbi:MAG: hypothetical protein HYZ83_06720 [Candidatus Omnitrophica bacterium]|nr:hypothetical protein [Candidatus Omnitrophota bacterium]
MKETIVKDDLLFHSVHGLCRVSAVVQSGQSKETSYALLPVLINRAKVRFVVPESSLESSGFSKLISSREADAILDYFKTGKKADSKCSQAWEQAVWIWSESYNKDSLKDARKRQKLERSVRGLSGELAYVLKMTVKEIAEKIRKNLGPVSQINPLVLTVLANADKD